MVGKIIVIIGSVTTATRLKKAVERQGVIEAEVIHTPAEISGGSCSYSVKLDFENMFLTLDTAKKQGIKIKKIYKEEKNNMEREYYDIS